MQRSPAKYLSAARGERTSRAARVAQRYWAGHLARTSYFLANAVVGTAAFSLLQVGYSLCQLQSVR